MVCNNWDKKGVIIISTRNKIILEKEQLFFKRNKSRLLKKYNSKYILVKNARCIGAFDSLEEAYVVGLDKFGNVPMFIKKMTKNKKPPLVVAAI